MGPAGGPPDAGAASELGAVDPRLASVTGDLRRRLRPVCRGWADAEFEALIQHIARTKARWADAADGA